MRTGGRIYRALAIADLLFQVSLLVVGTLGALTLVDVATAML